MASAPGYALPKPAIPKTLGILNVVFAVILILVGLCIGMMTVIAPLAQKFGQGALEQLKAQAEKQKAQVEQQKADDLKLLDDREKAATTDEEKAAIAKERDEVNARPVPNTPAITVNMTGGTEVLQDPTVQTFTVVQVLSGLILHIALLVAGIGLIRLTPWGRTLTLWWAGLQIAQLLILTVISFALVQPITQKYTEATLADLKKQMNGPNAPPNAALTVQMAEGSAKMAPVISVVLLVAGMTYPVICLILLRTAGARAACYRKPTEAYTPEI